jgi:hypothetical protein
MSTLASETVARGPGRHIERRLAEFVDRDAEMRQFEALLDSEDRPILSVFGGTGMGKTSLLLRMIHDCALRKLRKSEVVWNDTHPHDYMAVMRKMRDDLGVEHFKPFTDLINYYTDAAYKPQLAVTLVVQGSSNVEVAAGMQLHGSKVDTVAGMVIKDNMFVLPRSDLAVPEAVRREQLTACFLEGLRRTAETSLLVVFFDAVEKMSPDTNGWLWQQLLETVRAGTLRNVRFVLCGQQPPPQDRDWDEYVDRAELKPLGVDDIVLYLRKRAPRPSEETRRELATLLHLHTKGRPTDVAAAVDAYLKVSNGPDNGH